MRRFSPGFLKFSLLVPSQRNFEHFNANLNASFLFSSDQFSNFPSEQDTLVARSVSGPVGVIVMAIVTVTYVLDPSAN